MSLAKFLISYSLFYSSPVSWWWSGNTLFWYFKMEWEKCTFYLVTICVEFFFMSQIRRWHMVKLMQVSGHGRLHLSFYFYSYNRQAHAFLWTLVRSREIVFGLLGKLPNYFLYLRLRNTKSFPPQNFCCVPWIHLHGRHRCAHNTL